MKAVSLAAKSELLGVCVFRVVNDFRQRFQTKFFQGLIVQVLRFADLFLNRYQIFVSLAEINLLLRLGGADVARDLEVIGFDRFDLDPAGEPIDLLDVPVGE